MQYFTQVHCSHYLHGYGLHYITRSKRVNEEILSRRRPVSMQNFRFIVHIVYMIVACIIMYCQHYQ